MSCPLCTAPGGEVLAADALVQVVLAENAEVAGTCRVVLRRHVAEMSDLTEGEARELMRWVIATERAMRAVVRPDKVNLASLGNQVPHLHWHVIPRFDDDPWFPRAVWAEPVRQAGARRVPADLAARLRAALAACTS